MASKKEENVLHENLGRCTRSGRRLSAMPIIAASPSRTTRRSAKKLQEQMLDKSIDNIPISGNISLVSNEQANGKNNSAIISEIITETAQECDDLVMEDKQHESIMGNLVTLPSQLSVDDIIVEETEIEDEEKEEINYADAIIEECNPYEEEQEQEQEQEHMDHVDGMEMFETIPIEDENPILTVIGTDPVLDLEKTSSFPFDTVGGNSETSEDLIDNHQHLLHSLQDHEQEQKQSAELLEEHRSQKLHIHHLHGNSLEDNNGSVEISLLASLAGDNANSLPSVGGGESEELSEEICKKDDYESKVLLVEHCEKMDSESDTLSEPAIAEELVGDDGALMMSDATVINTELVSEDELPPMTLVKPQINDAEEVSDEELPAPKRAELPADAELISDDDELSIKGVQSAGVLPSSTIKRQSGGKESNVILGKKRKVDNSLSMTKSSNITSNDKMEDDDIDGDLIENEKSHQKKDKNEQYNPMSPTSESNDSIASTPPVEKKAKFDDSIKDTEEKENIRKDLNEQEQETATTINSKEHVQELEKSKEEKKERKHLPELDKYWRAVKNDPTDFTGWTYLLQYVDNESDAEAAREAYDAFLSHYPYCYGYWRKYADYEKRKGLKANCNAVFERGLEAIPLSVDLWIHYLAYVKSNPHHKPSADQEQFIRSQFERAVNACGLEFRSDKLWDAYIKWENESKSYQRIVQIYDRLLAIPTQGYSGHFDNLHDLINQHPIHVTMTVDEILQLKAEIKGTTTTTSSRSKERESDDSIQYDSNLDTANNETNNGDAKKDLIAHSTVNSDSDINNTLDDDDILKESVAPPPPPPPAFVDDNQKQNNVAKTIDKDIIKTFTEEECNEIKEKFISKRRKIHKNTATAVSSRWSFEEGIKRPYFHVKPLERCQLKNWKDYLDFEIEKGDRKRILVLFERCLIACALYEEFWLKMLRYLETQNDPNESSKIIIDTIRDVYRRACEIHHPDKPSLHLMWVAFEECQGNFEKGAEILTKLEVRVPNLLQIAYRRINVERRRGDYTKCKQLYEYYIETAKNKNIAGSLAIKYARFLNKICHDLDGGLNVLQQALEKDPANTRVVLQMIDLALQRSKVDESEVVAIMDKFMSRESIDPEQRVLFAQRKVEFLEDFGSTAKGLQDAQRALQIALTKANEAKKKRDSSPSRKNIKDTSSMSNTASASMYNSVNTNVNLNNSGTVVSTASAQTTTNYTYNSNNSTVAYYGQQQPQQQQQSAHHHHHQTSGSYPSQQSYDNYYNHWQYGSGYSGYGQWSGYGNYY